MKHSFHGFLAVDAFIIMEHLADVYGSMIIPCNMFKVIIFCAFICYYFAFWYRKIERLMGFVDVSQVTAALERVFVSNTATEWPLLLRLINLEIWLRGYREHGVNALSLKANKLL